MVHATEPDCFQLISREDLESMAGKRSEVNYLKGETIFKQGALAPHVLFIQAGLVKVYLHTGPGKIQNLWISKAGDFLAFSSIFGQRVYPYSAMALRESSLLMIDKESLGSLLKTNPEFAFRITTRNYRSENHLLEIISGLSYKQMRGKLAASLLYLSSESLVQEQVFECMTRQDIADFASISVESVIKFLKEFEKEDILELNSRQIKIRDRDRLEAISRTA